VFSKIFGCDSRLEEEREERGEQARRRRVVKRKKRKRRMVKGWVVRDGSGGGWGFDQSKGSESFGKAGVGQFHNSY
jgi:hypothetical protein